MVPLKTSMYQTTWVTKMTLKRETGDSKSNENGQFNAKEGTITFWIDGDGLVETEETTLVSMNNSSGGISLVVEEGYLRLYHYYNGKGKNQVEYPIDEFDENDRYYIAITWKVDDKLSLYIDGDEVDSKEI